METNCRIKIYWDEHLSVSICGSQAGPKKNDHSVVMIGVISENTHFSCDSAARPINHLKLFTTNYT